MSDSSAGWARITPYGTSDVHSVVLDWASHADFERWDLEGSRWIDDWPLDAQMGCDNHTGSRLPDDVVPNHLGLFVLSHRGKAVFEDGALAGQVQLLPVALKYRDSELGTFWILNTLVRLAALDRHLSDVLLHTNIDLSGAPPGSIKAIRRAVLDPIVLKGAPPVFRLEEYSRFVVASPGLRQRFSEHSVTGMAFSELVVRVGVGE